MSIAFQHPLFYDHYRRYMEGDKPREFKPFPVFKDWNIPATEETLEMGRSMKSIADMMFDEMKKNALSALQKDDPTELTESERAAICHFAGVRSYHDMITGKRIYEVAGFFKRDGMWIAVIPPRAAPTASSSAV